MTEEEDEPLVPRTALEHWVADTKARLYRTAKDGRMNTEFPDPVMWGLNLEQWKAIAEAQRLNLEQLRAQNNELKSLLTRAADALGDLERFAFYCWSARNEKLPELIKELRKAAE